MATRAFLVEIPADVDPAEGLEQARAKAKGVGITITGDTDRGTFSGAASGTYQRQDRSLRFEVEKKPFVVTWGMIERGLEKVFGRVTALP